MSADISVSDQGLINIENLEVASRSEKQRTKLVDAFQCSHELSFIEKEKGLIYIRLTLTERIILSLWKTNQLN